MTNMKNHNGPVDLGGLADKVGIKSRPVSMTEVAEKIGYKKNPIELGELAEAVEKHLREKGEK
jgi:hypothetical protein